MPYLITFAISGAKVNIFFELCKCVRIFFVFFFKKISILFAYLKNFSYLCIVFQIKNHQLSSIIYYVYNTNKNTSKF